MFGRKLLAITRQRLGIRARNEKESEFLRDSGWRDVWTQAACYTIWTWFWTDEHRREMHYDDKSYGMTLGTRRELIAHIFRPRNMNHARSALDYPRAEGAGARTIPGTGLILLSNRD